MIPKILGALGLTALMVASSLGVYTFLGAHQSKLTAAPTKPTEGKRAFVLPGTLYLEQSGALYSLRAGKFKQLTQENGWMQPSLFPDGSQLMVVKRDANYSDVYTMTLLGAPEAQLTNNIQPKYSRDIGDNHWAFYPRLSPNGKSLFIAFDSPKFGYEVDMSIWAMPYPGNMSQARLWTYHSLYTGGDVQPLPLASGGLIYTSYDYGTDSKLTAYLTYTNRAVGLSRAITDPDADCSQASLSPDGKQLAMICTDKKQQSSIYVGSWDGANLGPLKQVTSGQLVAQPTWAPDGSGIAYFAPAVSGGAFQLWWLPKAAYAPPSPSSVASPVVTPGAKHSPLPSPKPSPSPVPVAPIEVTTDLGFDATSTIAWGA